MSESVEEEILNTFSSLMTAQSAVQYMPYSPIHTLLIRSNLGFSIAQDFNMQLGGAGIQTDDLPITRQPALPTEPQPL